MPFKIQRSIFFALLVAAFSLQQTALANDKTGTTAFPFLRTGIGSRAVAMGGAYTGLANDEEALHYNPAGIVGLEGSHFILTYHNFVSEIQSGFVGYLSPLGEQHAYGISANYHTYGKFTETDIQGNVLGEFSGGNIVFNGSYARKMTALISAGATVKFIYEKVHDFSATGLAVDLGARYTSDRERYFAGLAIQNVGVQLSSMGSEKEGLPTVVRLGGAYRPRGVDLIGVLDLIKPVDNDFGVAFGMEYYKFQPLSLRLGWNSFGDNFRTSDSEDKLAGLGMGFGVRFAGKYQLSYGFAPAAELGDSHRVTLTGRF